MLDGREPWARLGEHRRKADEYPLDILVWGPAASDSLEYRKRVEIRDELTAAGHHASFSEDLMPTDYEVEDPLEEELLQADAAHLIVVLYGSRGTQSEIDTLLGHARFALKALVFVSPETLARALGSVSQATWKQLVMFDRVVKYTTEELEACRVVGEARAVAQKARRAVYAVEFKNEMAAG